MNNNLSPFRKGIKRLNIFIVYFALPALFIVLLAPRLNSITWGVSLIGTIAIALIAKLNGFPNAAIPVAAVCGAFLYYLAKDKQFLKRGDK